MILYEIELSKCFLGENTVLNNRSVINMDRYIGNNILYGFTFKDKLSIAWDNHKW